MNTPAHAVLNLAILGSGRGRGFSRPILAGAVVPDVPILVLYLWERLIAGTPDAVIWREAYYRSSWQDFIDVFNSIPLALAGLLVALRARRKAAAFFFGSALLHMASDLPLHRDDAHRHFFPASDWRFESSVSYWDPAHYGALAGLGEALAVLLASLVLWGRHPSRGVRAGLVGKLATVGQFAGVAAILLLPEQVFTIAVIAGVTGLLAVVHYLKRAALAVQQARG